MKRILFYLLFSLFFTFLYSQQKNLILRESYNSNDILNIEANLLYENISISTINGENIVVEISSNNSKLIPGSNVQNHTLKIEQQNWNFEKGDNCTVYIYIPKYYIAQEYKFQTRYGILDAENLTAQNSILINGSENTSIKNLTCDYFKFEQLEQGNLTKIQNLDCNYFDIFGLVGNIEVSLKKSPQAKSLIRTKEGFINLEIPKTESFVISARSNKSTFSNNYTKTKKAAPDWVEYTHNQGGPLIQLQTFQGEITVGE